MGKFKDISIDNHNMKDTIINYKINNMNKIQRALIDINHFVDESEINDTSVHLYTITFDTICITLYAKDEKDALQVFREENLPFDVFTKDGKPFVNFVEGEEDIEITITKIGRKRGVISVEAH